MVIMVILIITSFFTVEKESIFCTKEHFCTIKKYAVSPFFLETSSESYQINKFFIYSGKSPKNTTILRLHAELKNSSTITISQNYTFNDEVVFLHKKYDELNQLFNSEKEFFFELNSFSYDYFILSNQILFTIWNCLFIFVILSLLKLLIKK